MRRVWLRAASLTVVGWLVVTGCTAAPAGVTSAPAGSSVAASPTPGSSGPAPSGSAPSGSAPSGSVSSTPGPEQYLVSIGDSYGTGYRPTAAGGHVTSDENFVSDLGRYAAASGSPVTVVNFACAGATTADLTGTAGCPADRRAPGSPEYTESQIDAATAFLEAHRGAIAAVTVVIGGNDLNSCIPAAGTAASDRTASCLSEAVAGVGTRLTPILQRVRAAVGQEVPVVGLTYPDIYLGLWVHGARELATASVDLFRTQLNPVLAQQYRAIGATFVDLTAAFGAYGSMSSVSTLEPWGSLPTPVAEICRTTYFCSDRDLHPTSAGHRRIADAVVAALYPAG